MNLISQKKAPHHFLFSAFANLEAWAPSSIRRNREVRRNTHSLFVRVASYLWFFQDLTELGISHCKSWRGLRSTGNPLSAAGKTKIPKRWGDGAATVKG